MKKKLPIIWLFIAFPVFMNAQNTGAASGTQMATLAVTPGTEIYQQLIAAFDTLKFKSIRPAEGYIKYDYLIPAGFYKQMWDWDGFFIGCYLASHNKEDAKYLMWWVLNFANSMDKNGYVSGCINTKGPRPIFGKFAMKPFLSQGAYFASLYMDDFKWIEPVYKKLQQVLVYREKTQFDPKYKLFFWDNAVQSGADNNVVLTNDSTDRSAIIATDINTFQLREYISMKLIAAKLGKTQDVDYYGKKAEEQKIAMLTTLWFPKDLSFYNVRRNNQEVIKRISYSNFIPLIQDLIPMEEGRAMIEKYLWNDEHMLAEFGLRSLSRQDKQYNNECMIIPYSNWQGPLWINANFLYSVALVKYGYKEEAAKLSLKLARVLLDDINACGTMHENYDADSGRPLAPTAEQSPNKIFTGFVGWNLLEQNMIEGAMEGRWMLLELPMK
ncbi:MAG: trehalase family glycosidase [Bacteroidetes bacterium]|nr:trehalase family glycosidase [Bacteroidota bacterium]